MFTHAPLSDWRACFKVRVTSQNGPQPLVSKKCDLADAKGSGLTSIGQVLAFITVLVRADRPRLVDSIDQFDDARRRWVGLLFADHKAVCGAAVGGLAGDPAFRVQMDQLALSGDDSSVLSDVLAPRFLLMSPCRLESRSRL